jgi:hypothetical protein
LCLLMFVAVVEIAVPVAAAATAAFPFVDAVLAVVDVGVLLGPNWRAILLALLWFSLAVSPGCFCRCDSSLLVVLGLLVCRELLTCSALALV